jgi:hypothetical protein
MASTPLWPLLGLFGFIATSAAAQEPTHSIDSLQAAVNRFAVRLDSLEAGQCPVGVLSIPSGQPTGEPRLDSLVASMERLAARVTRLSGQQCMTPGGVTAPADTGDTSLSDLRAAAAAASAGIDSAPPDTSHTTQFISRQRNGNIYNPEISATGDIRLVGREGRQKDNGIAREFEVAMQSTLDPYSATKIFLSFADGEVEVEEGYIYYAGLPGKLRLDVGKFRQQVGDLNRWHLHALPETEYPLVYQRFMGPEGLSGIGLSLYTAVPISIAGGTHEIWLQGTTAESNPLFADGRQPTGLAHLQNFWQLTRSTYAQLGFTGILGANRDSSLSTNLTGVDLRVTHRPPNAGTRRDLTFRLEGYRLHATEAGIVTNRYGVFADAAFKLSQRWTVGARYDYVEAARGPYGDEWRITPVITWWQSEFVFLRLQGEHRHELDGSDGNELTFQVVWAMGPHKHETY